VTSNTQSGGASLLAANLKASSVIKALHLEWLPFRLTDEDAARFEPGFELLDARSDELAGLLWLLLGAGAKFSDSAASKQDEPATPAD
jgi:hypothetical protein